MILVIRQIANRQRLIVRPRVAVGCQEPEDRGLVWPVDRRVNVRALIRSNGRDTKDHLELRGASRCRESGSKDVSDLRRPPREPRDAPVVGRSQNACHLGCLGGDVVSQNPPDAGLVGKLDHHVVCVRVVRQILRRQVVNEVVRSQDWQVVPRGAVHRLPDHRRGSHPGSQRSAWRARTSRQSCRC